MPFVVVFNSNNLFGQQQLDGVFNAIVLDNPRFANLTE